MNENITRYSYSDGDAWICETRDMAFMAAKPREAITDAIRCLTLGKERAL
jgi:hypothetical protein